MMVFKNFLIISLVSFFLTSCEVKEGDQSGALIAGHGPAENAFNVTLPSNSTRTTGETLQFTLTHPFNVTVTGTPRLSLTIGVTNRFATYQSGSGSKNLVFSYTIVAGENDSNGIEVSSTLDLNGGSLQFTSNSGTENCSLNLSISNTSNIKVDALTPTINSITAPANGTYRSGIPLVFQIVFSEKVMITGTPRLQLTVGGDTRYAALTSSTTLATQNLTFSYVPEASDLDSDGITVDPTIDLNGGSLKDLVGIDGTLTFTAPDTTSVRVDANSPYVVSVTPPANGNYGSEQSLDFIFNYSESVNITGSPSFSLNIAGTNRTVVYYSGSGTSQITFRYVIQPGEVDGDGLTSGATFTMTGATIRDLGSVNAVNGFIMPSLSQILIIDNRPSISSYLFNAGTYYIGQSFTFTALFNQPVTITGSPQVSLALDAGGPVLAQYVSGSGTENIVFSYTVAEGTNDTNGVVITSPLILNSGSIKSVSGINANLVFTSPSTGTLRINGVKPVVNSISGPTPGSYMTGENLNFSVNFSETVNIHTSANVRLNVQIGSNARQATYVSGSNTTALTFRYTLQAGDAAPEGILFSGFDLTGAGAIKDGTLSVANNADLTYSAPDLSGVLVNTTTPTITSVTSPADDVYKIGEDVNFTLQFSETVNVTSSPRLSLTVGGAPKYATYVSGSGSNNLLFRYTVQAGEEDTDGIMAATVLDLNGGTIKGLTLGSADLNVPAQALTNVRVDGIAPTIQTITNPTNGTYTVADTKLTFSVAWNDTVTVSGTPYLTLDIGGEARQAVYTTGSNTTTLTFEYAFTADDLDLDGVNLDPLIQLSGGSIEDSNGNAAELNFGTQNLSLILVNFTNMISWWDLDQTSSVSTAVCGIAMCAMQVSDRSGNNSHITASGAARPEYRSSGFAGGNRGHLQFDDTSMVMSAITSLTQVRTVFIAFQSEVAVMSNQDLLHQDGMTIYVRAGSNAATSYGVDATSSLNGQALTAAASMHAAGLSGNTPYILAVQYGTGYDFSLPFVGSTNFGGKIAEILIYSSELTPAQILKVQNYLNSKHQVY